MRFSTIATFALSAIAVSAYSNTTDFTTTEVVTAYTTYCPAPTTIVENNMTYTVTEATTLTITDCPCTRTRTYTTITTTSCPGGCAAPSVPVGTGVSSGPSYPNGTVAVPTGSVPGSSSAPNVTAPSASVTSSPEEFQGAANRATVAAGALAGLIGVAAYLL